jgi:hypothetical protein
LSLETEQNFSICPKLLINAELYGLVLACKAQKRNTIKFGRPVCNQKMLKVGPKFLINAELYGLVLAARLKKGIPSNLGG